VIALVWVLSASTVLFFSPGAEVMTIKKAAFILAQIFFFIAITLPFDIKDMIYDRIKTIPNTIGVKRSIAISLFCLAAYITLILVFGTNPVFKLAHVLFSFLALYVIYKQKNIQKLYKLYYYVDGLILAQTGFVFAFGHLLLK
jgi:4-hydroxybenzoate polyprenyltransferase